MNKKQQNKNHHLLQWNSWLKILLRKISNLEQFILTIAGAFIGLTLTYLFVVVVLASLYVALFGDQAQTPILLQLALSSAGAALGGFIGYLSGRRSSSKRK